MYVIHPTRLIFLANPRTGSTSVRNMLLDRSLFPEDQVECIHDGENPRFPREGVGWGQHHGLDLQALNHYQSKGYQTCCVVRNPFEHWVSWWWLHRQQHSFSDFCQNIDSIVSYTLPQTYPNTIQVLLHWADTIIPFPDFPDWFHQRLGHRPTWTNRSRHSKPWRDHYKSSPSCINLVIQRASKDFSVLGLDNPSSLL